MRWISIFVLVFAGCASSTKTCVSVYVEKELWVERDFEKPDAKVRFEYKLEQTEPWPFQSRD